MHWMSFLITLFDGTQFTYQHPSSQNRYGDAICGLQPSASKSTSGSGRMDLSGLTCTEENFTVKAGAQRVAAELGLLLIAPDTAAWGWRTGRPGRFITTSDSAPDFMLMHARAMSRTTEWGLTLSTSFRMVKTELPADMTARASWATQWADMAPHHCLRNQDRYASDRPSRRSAHR